GVVRIPRRQVTAARLDSLAASPPTAFAVRYSAGLRAVKDAARDLRGADSVRVTLLTVPRWSAWSAGMAPLRRAAWEAAISPPPLGSPGSTAQGDSTEFAGAAVVVAAPGGGRFAVPALAATGWEVRAAPAGGPIPREMNLILVLAPGPGLADLRSQAEAGSTVVIAAPALTPELR